MDCHHHQRQQIAIDQQILQKTVALFAAIADKNRLAILLLLQQNELCVSEIASLQAENIKTVSARLKKLFDANLVNKRKDATHVYYSLADKHVIDILYNAIDHVNH